MNGVLDYLSIGYYTGVIAHLFAVIGFFTLQRQKKKELKIFELYLIVYIFNEVSYLLSSFLQNERHFIVFVSRLVDYLFTMFEFFVFYVYLSKMLKGFLNSYPLKLLSFVYAFISLVILLNALTKSEDVLYEALQNAYIIQATCLLFLCVLYFLKIFNSRPTLDLFNEPSFWIITGLTFCMLCTLPLTFLLNNIHTRNYLLYSHLFSIFYFFYIILFIMIIRASLCKKIIAS
jgi:hypothetical protein